VQAPARSRTWPFAILVVPRQQADEIAAECFVLDSCGVQVEEAGDASRLTVYFESTCDPGTLSARLVSGLQAAGLWSDEYQTVLGDVEQERDWNETWKQFYQPVWATENIVVHPPWIPVQTHDGQMSIAIDPAMAFGTGGHESTQLALEAIEQSCCDGRRCLDVGTGSGILSIALIQLGAHHVTAVDIDPVVIDNASANLRANLGEDADRTRLLTGSVGSIEGDVFEFIVANIESHLARPLLPGIVASMTADGTALFSGFVESERDRFLGWLQEVRLTVDETWSKNNWFSCRAHKTASRKQV
jgi:ribosomal protein L11 methyltransferase